MRGIIADLFRKRSRLKGNPPGLIWRRSDGTEAADAVHIACAIIAGCDYLITIDDRMLKFVDHRIKEVSPTDMIYLMKVRGWTAKRAYIRPTR